MSDAVPSAPERFNLLARDVRVAIESRAREPQPLYNLLNFAWHWVASLGRRFSRLIDLHRAGTLRPPRARAARVPASDDAAGGSSAPAPSAKPRERAPWKSGWLIPALGYRALRLAEELRVLLDDPVTAALLAAAPQSARLIRPLCRALGVAPANLPPLPPRRKRTRSPRRRGEVRVRGPATATASPPPPAPQPPPQPEPAAPANESRYVDPTDPRFVQRMNEARRRRARWGQFTVRTI